MNRQSYLAELAKLLGFMSAWDRRDALMKFEAMFDEAGSDEELIAALGSPTKLAIGLASNYVPSPAPVSMSVDNVESGEESGEIAAEISEEASGEEKEEAPAVEEVEAESPEEETVPETEELPAEVAEEPAAPVRRRKVRPFGLIASILFGLVFGVPIALVLVLIGVPFLVSGIAVLAADIWCVLSAIPFLTMLSDILVVIGVGGVICGLGLLVAWFGLWLSFELGYLWIGGVVLRLGRALTYKKEVAAA